MAHIYGVEKSKIETQAWLYLMRAWFVAAVST